ncbi:hypothetical protein [uncultured Pseudoteredinibacter sp.]|uniref:hypothetical protein n=1 Tax=uncultured Pseudoteredinibacter sp. TaxID=1641701 RepID=UPI0026282D7D|nr:hypothetical protein [uncultured Pseudoteredinibacter sp.]
MDLVFQASWPALWAALLSPQGIIASCLFCIGVLGFLLFQDMGENLRSSLLSLALFGLLALAYSYLQFSQPAIPLAQTSAPVIAATPQVNNSAIITRGEGDLTSDEAGYIYIGRYHKKSWQSALFDGPEGPLRTGDVLQLNTNREMFACAPYRKKMLDLRFTYCKEVIGQAQAEDNVRVARPPIIVGLSNVWVYVTKVSG